MSCLSTLSNETDPKHIRNIAKTDPKTKSKSQCTVFGKNGLLEHVLIVHFARQIWNGVVCGRRVTVLFKKLIIAGPSMTQVGALDDTNRDPLAPNAYNMVAPVRRIYIYIYIYRYIYTYVYTQFTICLSIIRISA